MHEVLEIVMPQQDNVEEAVAEVMAQFDETREDPEERTGHEFWDFYVIGGRWAGHKMQATLDKDTLNAFYAAMTEKKVTVSGLQCGKQEISPASQIPMVDAQWTEFFPEYAGRACPLFNHANDQYENDCLYGDVLRVKDTSLLVESSRLIVAAPDYKGEKLEAKAMFSTSVWNGCNFEDTTWDGTLGSALKLYEKKLTNYNDEYKAANSVDEDWIVVTVDYHN